LGTFKRRLASKKEYFQLFLVCAFTVHVWAIIDFLQQVPELNLRMSIFQMAGVAAYVLVFALFESLLVFGLLFVASLMMPTRLLNDRILPLGSIFILMTAIPAYLIHLYSIWHIHQLDLKQWVILWAGVGIVLMGATIYWMVRNKKVEHTICSGIEKISVLSLVYLTADLAGGLLILFKNLP
jgi:hypothetical protein